ncbi:MAG: hypothetical protein INR62_07805, partial [Rhodospirillales bacterium]|nr:hypothetical protein [Acetobacter sp.]
MAAVPEARERGRRQGAWLVFACWLAAFLAIALCAWNQHAILRATMRQEASARAMQPDTAPGRGLCAALAAQAPPAQLDADSFCWINLVQHQIAAGELRNRHQSADNLPDGRESHWSASFAWWLLVLATPVHFLGGRAWPDAVADVAAAANPILLALTLVVLARWLWRHAGAWTAGITVVTLSTLVGVEWDFGYGRPDHHGLHLIAFLGMLLNALGAGLGWVQTGQDKRCPFKGPLVRPRPWPDARRGMIWSGIFGGVGLWIGATQQMFVIGAVGAAAGLGSLMFVRTGSADDAVGSAVQFTPSLWRLWARVGALTSLGFYLLEYFPAHLSMQLEVNHPLYALAWLGGGELIYTAGEWARDRRRPDRRGWMRIILGIACLMGLPLAAFAGPADWYLLRDPLSLRTWSLVNEFQPLVARWTWYDILHALCQIGSLWAVLPTCFVLLLHARRRSLPPWRRMSLVVACTVAGVCCVWVFAQSRWLGYASAAFAVGAMVVSPSGEEKVARRRWPWGLLALTVPGWLLFGVQQTLVDAERVAEKDFSWLPMGAEIAWNLRLYQGNNPEPPRVVAPPTLSTMLTYYGGARTLGSLYWENLAGCRSQLQLLDDKEPDEPDARRITRACKLDYIVVISDPAQV